MIFNYSYLYKSILNVYSPMSPKMFLGPAPFAQAEVIRKNIVNEYISLGIMADT